MYEKVTIEAVITESMNYAMQQNYVPVIRRLTVSNMSKEPLEDLKLIIHFEPEFADIYEQPIAQLPAGQSVELTPVRLVLHPDFILSLTERMVANLSFRIYRGNVEQEAEPVAQLDRTIELLAYDQWSGSNIMPELLAAFVLPNHPCINNIIIQAGEFLNRWTNNPSFTAYQSNNPNVVKHQMAAIYAALQKENIAYVVPPAGFEDVGQRIRLCDAVLDQHLGCCLDLSLLYAACLETVGLNPVIILMKGHAFAGCWLEEQNFPETIQDDVSGIKKRIAEGIEELCLVECTAVTAGKSVDFDEAVRNGARHLEETEQFRMLIDIARSRSGGIRPIPMRILENGTYKSADYGKKTKAELTGAPQEVDRQYLNLDGKNEPLTKQKMWERKLLDMSLRNMLLSFRVTQNTLQLLAVNLNQLEDALANGTEFKLMAYPEDWENTLRDKKIYELENTDTAMGEFAQSEFQNKRIRTFLPDTELEPVLKNLNRKAKVSLEENGTNTLYLALGFLKWYESDISEKERLAPLVLVPVDIVRKLQQRAFVLRVRDEEPQMNITLLEYIRQDFGIDITGLDPLPVDEEGINLKMIFNTVRQAVMGKKRWDVEEYAFLGLFSFSQFIMWNDIRNRSDELKANPVVASLMSGKLEWQPGELGLSTGELDKKISLTEHAIPLSADSSQMLAICSAAEGQSFVLHGPPGTGKSQTITNMIANALYHGKSVLFVAEKMAALRVVQNRLSRIGLEPFCLEVHSNKARKKDVLDRMEATLQIGHVKEPQEYEATAERIRNLRNELNGIMEELHQRRNYGFSLYEAIAMYESNSVNGHRGLLAIEQKTVQEMTPAQYEIWRDSLHKFRAAVNECGGIYRNPLQEMCSRNYSVAAKAELQKELELYRQELFTYRDAYWNLNPVFHFPQAPSGAELQRLYEICRIISSFQYLPEAMFTYQGTELLTEAVNAVVRSGRERDRLRQTILESFDTQVFTYDYRSAQLKWKLAQSEWAIPKMTKSGKLVKELALYAKQPKMITKANITSYYELLVSYANEEDIINKTDSTVRQLFGILWSENPNWDLIENTYAAVLRLRQACAGNVQAVSAALQDQNGFRSWYGGMMQAFINAGSAVLSREKQLWDKYQVYLDELYSCPDRFTLMEGKISEWLSSMDDLKAWCVMLNLQDELVTNGLTMVVNALRQGTLTTEQMLPAFECALGFACANDTIEKSPVLSQFHGAGYDEKIERFREADEKFRTLTINEIIAKLSAKIPAYSGNVSNSSEIGILQRAIKSAGRMMPLRRLFDSIPNLLRMLFPCMLMSPISVAQYIDPKFPKFDLVIFDEASQLPTSEAVGAIARGNSVVVVGDPKQLPPTTFFASNRVDEENLDKEDLESVLDDCLALTMPQEHLLWHYRSRHESLIAYSNMKYYENKLYTFPSPNDLKSEVIYVPVEGVYDRSKTKQNRAEAEKIVEEVVRRLRDPELQKESIGVVTFSSVQQNLIEDLLEEAFTKEPELDTINQSSFEPLFVKNLENVQGDERDVILFSVGYGPDKDGKVTMNFGPLNRDGGWRRLNVAISRARKRMMIFSTLRPEQIDESRTLADGVIGLKGFLEFAARGKNVLAAGNTSKNGHQSGVIESVAAALQKQGYEVKCNIGCSGYRIDIGIVDPEAPDRYLLAILCDGNELATEVMARDRSILQPDVLKSLGWNIYRLWTLDWLDAPERELGKIKAAMEQAVLVKQQREAEKFREQNQDEAAGSVEPQSQSDNTEKARQQNQGDIFSHTMFEKEEPAKPLSHAVEYVVLKAAYYFPTEEFYLPKSQALIGRQIGNIIEREGPICYKRLCRKELAFWGISRSGAKIEQMLSGIIRDGKYQITKSNGTYFYWKKGQNPETYTEYRVPTVDPETKRPMDEIASEEIANAILDILAVQVSLSREDLIRETAKVFGFVRLGGVIESSVDNGIALAAERGKIVNGERITLSIEV